jgi:prepilin-type N-terminal cleavage/methylation domain-containing protein
VEAILEETMDQRGVTLIELITVLAIVGIMVCLSDGFVSAATRYQAKTVRTELAAELRAARHLAMSERQKVRVVFDSSVPAIRTELVNAPYTVLRSYNFSGKDISVETLSNGPFVTFYSNGRTATPNTVTLMNSRGERWRMTVSITGRINA